MSTQRNYYRVEWTCAALYLEFETIIFSLLLPGAENCPYDYIKIYDGKDESAAVIGTFCGMGKFPYSIIGTSQDLFVEFVSSPAGKVLQRQPGGLIRTLIYE